MSQPPTVVDDLENELERFRKEWLEELAAEKGEGPKTIPALGESTVDADRRHKVRVISVDNVPFLQCNQSFCTHHHYDGALTEESSKLGR
ncbi:hypothetical protein Vi05172_g5160 [Venturia inaequalis]|nr:hypothetical protein Vi05172_g5160 [Venturia inaequalis]